VGISKEISSGMNGFACRKPWYRLKPESSDFQASNKALNPLHGYKQSLLLQKFQVID